MTCWMIPSGQEAPPVINTRLVEKVLSEFQSGRATVLPCGLPSRADGKM